MAKLPARIPIGKLWSRQRNEALVNNKVVTQPGEKSPFGEPVPNLIREGWGRIFTLPDNLPLRGVRGVYFVIENKHFSISYARKSKHPSGSPQGESYPIILLSSPYPLQRG